MGVFQDEGGGGGGIDFKMKCENSGSCLKHPLEGGAAFREGQMGVKGLSLTLRLETSNTALNSS